MASGTTNRPWGSTKMNEACHVLHLEIRPNYCTNENIINAFLTLKNATTIAEIEISDNHGNRHAVLGSSN